MKEYCMKKDLRQKLDISISGIFDKDDDDNTVSVIVLVNGNNKDCVKDKLAKCGCVVKYELDIVNGFALDAGKETLAEIAECEHVMYITSDIEAKMCMDIARPTVGVSDTEGLTGKGIGIAVIDTGIYPHEDIKNNITGFIDYVNNKKKPYDDNGHGTHCAGIIASNGFASAGRYRGIAPGSDLIGLKVMDYKGEGNISNILAAMNWINNNAEAYHIKIASLSLGAGISSYAKYDPLILAAEKLWNNGITVVAAAGNDGPAYATINSPGAGKNVITVGCSDDKKTVDPSDDTIADFSSRGPSRYTKYKPDIVAPGVDIISLANNANGYVAMSGTSMSTPIISGCCALMLEKYPNLKPDEIKQKLIKNAYSLHQTRFSQGSGLVSVNAILK